MGEKELSMQDSSSTMALESWLTQLKSANVRGLILTTNENLSSLPLELIKQKLGLPLHVEGALSPKKLEDILGSEQKHVIYDARNIFDANTFCALNGVVAGSGILILILNRLALDHLLEDAPLKQEKSAENVHLKDCLLKRFNQLSRFQETTLIVNSNSIRPKQITFHVEPADLSEQADAIEKICRVSTGHSRRPLVLTADRGRGKTAAIGISAAKIISEKEKTIVVTAPKLSTLGSFFKHACQLLDSNKLEYETKLNRTGQVRAISVSNGGLIKFVSLDKVKDSHNSCHLLMIDEAAAVPVTRLEALSRLFNRVVFSTTIHGYEGNGQGFNVRFKKHLLNIRPQTRFVHMTSPIRWSKNDPLEKDLFNAFLLNAEPQIIKKSDPTLNPHNLESLNLEQLSKANLLTNENELKRVFSLLINAHYQTRPNDLERILSSQNIQIYALKADNILLGVTLLNIEPPISDETCLAISERDTQLKRQLLTQSIITGYGIQEFGRLNTARVMRIAVQPEFQGNGLGSQMLKVLENKLKDEFDMLGASFAALPAVSYFWRKNEFAIVSLGHGKDTSSGDYSMEVLKPLTKKASTLLHEIESRFEDRFLFGLNHQYSEISPLLCDLVISGFERTNCISLSKTKIEQISLFCRKKRSFWQVNELIASLYLSVRNHPEYKLKIDDSRCLTAVIFLRLDSQLLASHFKLTGKKAIECKIRELTLQLLELISDK